MGVHGLWKLIEPAGKPVPVETLDNKVLAVDVSIWLHQLMKGYQTPAGASVANAYLLGLFSRVCKLLFTNVKPVFVFDGGVPQLKKKTIAARQQQKNKSAQASEKLREQLLKNLLKQKAVSQVLEEIRGQNSPKKKAPDMFELPPLPQQEDSGSEVEELSESSSEEDVKPVKMKFRDLHSIDVKSEEFKSLPADMRHDILTELKETRKQNSWGRIHEMPEESNDFSKYQMSRLLKRRSVQVSLEEAEKEMGGRTLSLHDVEALLAEGGIEINPQLGKRIASDDVTRFIYVRESDKQSQTSQNVKISELKSTKEEENSKSLADMKIKEEIISFDELSDTELMREVEAIETVHKIKEEKETSEKKEENVEFGTEDIFDQESSCEETFLDDIIVMKENSGLSQEQILAIIKDQNRGRIENVDQNAPSTSKDSPYLFVETSGDLKNVEDDKTKNSIKTNATATISAPDPQAKASEMLYFKMMERMHGFKNKTKSSKNKETKKDSKINKGFIPNIVSGKRSKVSVKPADLSALASNTSDSDKESDNNMPCNISNLVSPNMTSISLFKKKPYNETSVKELKLTGTNGVNQTAELSASSDSDNDFVEVSSTKESDVSRKESKGNTDGIHIELKPTTGPIEDDIFADIFSEEKENKNTFSIKGLEKNTEESINKKGPEIQIEIQPGIDSIEEDMFPVMFSNQGSNLNENVNLTRIKQLGNKEINSKKIDEIKVALKKNAENYVNENISLDEDLSASDDSSDSLLPISEAENITLTETAKGTVLTAESKEHNDECKEIEPKKKYDSESILSVPGNMQESAGSEDADQSATKEGKHNSSCIERLNQNDSETPLNVSGQQRESEESDDDPAPREQKPDDNIPVEKPKRQLNTKQLEKLQDILETKEREIVSGQNREDRLATSMTDQMYQEAQELLRLFGVPYVVAPMEAEAQCAFMDLAGLTQGTITDDSDIWLFGGRTVYKNFFDQKKFVLEFKADNINHYFKLGRAGLVLLALLVGSDYTEGVAGVGPVTALEILAAFPPPDTLNSAELTAGLLRFKRWWQSPAGHPGLARKLRNVEVQQGFPSHAVVAAYLQPRVDESREPFSWSAPDLPGLRDYAERKFGWSRARTDQILMPVVNRMSQKTSQLTLHTFFGAVPNIAAHREQMSRRVQSAVSRLEGGGEEPSQPRPRPRPRQSRGRGRGQEGEGTSGRTPRGRGRARIPLDDDDDKFIHGKVPEVIPQRERDRQEALKRKQQAVEVFKKKKGMKKRRNVRQIKPDAGLSESSSEEN